MTPFMLFCTDDGKVVHFTVDQAKEIADKHIDDPEVRAEMLGWCGTKLEEHEEEEEDGCVIASGATLTMPDGIVVCLNRGQANHVAIQPYAKPKKFQRLANAGPSAAFISGIKAEEEKREQERLAKAPKKAKKKSWDDDDDDEEPVEDEE